ncbi:MAG: hypothetical protein ACKORE_02845 [Bacteroidota bacterium]
MSEPLLHDILLLYLYNETDLCESHTAQSAIDSDPLIAGEFRELAHTTSSLDNLLIPAPKACLSAVLQYARATAP